MKKIIFTILTFLQLSFLPIALATPLAPTVQNQDLQTRIILDNSMKPDNAPGINFANTKDLTDGKSGSESQFANFLLQLLAGALISIAAPVAVIIIAVAGLMAVTSNGNQGQMDKAKQTLTHAIIGLIIIIFSWIIVKAVINVVLNVNPSQNTSTTNNTPAAGGGPAATQSTTTTTPAPAASKSESSNNYGINSETPYVP